MGNVALDHGSTSSIANMLDGPLDTNSLMGNSVDWGVDGGGNLLDGVGLGLVDKRLGDLLDGSHGSSKSLTSKGGDVLEDGLSNMGGPDNGRWLVGGLSHRVGDGGDLGAHLSVGMGLSSGVGKVTSQSVVLDGGRVMSWCSDQEGGRSSDKGGR